MTTITLTKSGYNDLTLYSPKVEEVSNKEIISYAYPYPRPDWPSPPTAIVPHTEAIDLLSITREFTITGIIDSSSTSAGNAQAARDTLINMQRSGGTVSFKYGAAGDVTGSGYTPSANNMYYHANGFTCHIKRVMVEETAKGGAESYTGAAVKGAPEQYEVTVVLTYAIEIIT